MEFFYKTQTEFLWSKKMKEMNEHGCADKVNVPLEQGKKLLILLSIHQSKKRFKLFLSLYDKYYTQSLLTPALAHQTHTLIMPHLENYTSVERNFTAIFKLILQTTIIDSNFISSKRFRVDCQHNHCASQFYSVFVRRYRFNYYYS